MVYCRSHDEGFGTLLEIPIEEKRLHPAPEIRESPSCTDQQGSVSGARSGARRRDRPGGRKGYHPRGEKGK